MNRSVDFPPCNDGINHPNTCACSRLNVGHGQINTSPGSKNFCEVCRCAYGGSGCRHRGITMEDLQAQLDAVTKERDALKEREARLRKPLLDYYHTDVLADKFMPQPVADALGVVIEDVFGVETTTTSREVPRE